MSLTKRWIARLRSRARAWGLRARLIAVVATLLVAAGCVWLAVSMAGRQPPWAPVSAEPMDRSDVAAAADFAAKRNIPHRVESGRLWVPAEQVEHVRGLLAYEGLLDGGRPIDFEALAEECDLWQSPAQTAKRWQAAKMAALSRLIGHFPGVHKATVLLEGGVARGLGRPAVPPTAAVHVEPDGQTTMTARLVGAIADLVAGSVAGMDRQEVRIIAGGRSYRVDPDLADGGDDPAERLRAAEAFYLTKIQSSLAYIPGVTVGVSVALEGRIDRCRGASVGVPRSYLLAAYRARYGSHADPNGRAMETFAEEMMAKVRQTVVRLIAAEDAGAVKVDWHQDVAAGAVAASAGSAARESLLEASARGAAVATLGLLGLLSAVAAVRRPRSRRRAAPGDQGDAAEATPAESDRDGAAALQAMAPSELAGLLQGEHPQTIALVLSCVEPAVAAGVLASLGRPRQVEVSRRIAEASAVDPQVIAEVVRGLRSRRTAGPAAVDEAGGIGKVAQILHHAGYATEKAVLDGLTGDEPSLADSIRRQLFVFEDVAVLPRGVLRSALESLGSDELAVALRTAGKEVKEKVLSSLSRESAAKVRAEMERIGPVRLSDVEAAQERVVAAVRRLEVGRYVAAGAGKGSEVLA